MCELLKSAAQRNNSRRHFALSCVIVLDKIAPKFFYRFKTLAKSQRAAIGNLRSNCFPQEAKIPSADAEIPALR
jgi:hypothetical protein